MTPDCRRNTKINQVWDVLALGAVAVDDFFYVDHHPTPDSKTRVRAMRREGGGLAGTALVAAARLGSRVAYCGVLGDDELSAFSIAQLEREGVDCSPVLRRTGARPRHSVIIVDKSTGGRAILASAEGAVALTPKEISPELIRRCRVLFVDHTVVEAGCCAADLAHEAGIPVVADIERTDVDNLNDLVARVDHLIIGLELGRKLTGEGAPPKILAALVTPHRRCCVVTDGARGCWYEAGDGLRHVPAFPVAAVDTTGCGDVFHGAYASCLARGETIERAIVVASAAGALKATQSGRGGIPDWVGVERLIMGG